jgi:ankyrin repeat protein
LENEISEKNQESNSTPWTSTDNNLVADFITFIRAEVGHKCKKCATRPDNFVESLIYDYLAYKNYLLPDGIDFLMFVGFSPNKKIDKFGNTVLHVLANNEMFMAYNDSAVPVAKLLIEKGFHFNRTNNKGKTVLELVQNFPDSALYHYLNQTMNPSASMQSLKFLSARAVSQADFDLVARSNGTAIPIELIDFIKCKGKVKVD